MMIHYSPINIMVQELDKQSSFFQKNVADFRLSKILMRINESNWIEQLHTM